MYTKKAACFTFSVPLGQVKIIVHTVYVTTRASDDLGNTYDPLTNADGLGEMEEVVWPSTVWWWMEWQAGENTVKAGVQGCEKALFECTRDTHSALGGFLVIKMQFAAIVYTIVGPRVVTLG